MSENETEAAQAWSAIEPGHGVVALDPQWAALNGLPATKAHPINSNKAVYIVEAYHAIHCLVCWFLHRLKRGDGADTLFRKSSVYTTQHLWTS